MRDGQGLEVANASAETIAAIDLLREEWLAFGKRLPEAVAAAEPAEEPLDPCSIFHGFRVMPPNH